MTFEVRPSAVQLRQPWKNGGGVTTEVVAAPRGAHAGSDFDWRISFADVAGSGEFSKFSGIDRVITLLTPTSMALHFDGHVEDLVPFQPFAFDGGLPVSCVVDAPSRDLNVMTRRGRAQAQLEIIDVGRLTDKQVSIEGPLGETRVLLVLDGEVSARDSSLAAGDAFVTDEGVTVEGSGRVAVARVTSRGDELSS